MKRNVDLIDGKCGDARTDVSREARPRRGLAARRAQAAAATVGPTRSITPIASAADDVVFEQGGVKVIVAADDLELIDGTEVDFIKDGLNEAFKFRNPNVKGECGCGESFSV